MKLRNKKTGEIFDGDVFSFGDINSLAELNEEWEDYEEPKVYWFLTGRGDINYIEDDNTKFDNDHKQVGNYFETEEEAEKAVEKIEGLETVER